MPDARLVRRLLIRVENFSYESCNSDEPEVIETAIQEPQDIQFYIIQAVTGEIVGPYAVGCIYSSKEFVYGSQ